jgi:hypothetical protein
MAYPQPPHMLIPLRALWTTPEVEISAEIGNEQ